jgi:hypothetical protein
MIKEINKEISCRKLEHSTSTLLKLITCGLYKSENLLAATVTETAMLVL